MINLSKNYVQQNKLRITGKGYTNDIKWQITMHVVIIFIYWTGIKYMAINILCRLLLFILHTDSLGCSAASLKFIEHPLSNCDTPLSDLTASLLQQIYSFHSVTVSKKGKRVKNWWRLLFLTQAPLQTLLWTSSIARMGVRVTWDSKKVMSKQRRIS